MAIAMAMAKAIRGIRSFKISKASVLLLLGDEGAGVGWSWSWPQRCARVAASS